MTQEFSGCSDKARSSSDRSHDRASSVFARRCCPSLKCRACRNKTLFVNMTHTGERLELSLGNYSRGVEGRADCRLHWHTHLGLTLQERTPRVPEKTHGRSPGLSASLGLRESLHDLADASEARPEQEPCV
ncbi:Uncharacterized protein DAT39_020540 [Clarias magur]|uniref:Uncharacterized protein n=1 Tax=Clarias magur TaxID=1594786 RepID=A0A8J4U2T1_CLAMG|nr:Uncharacterized protein DAT39_020540 [Clarias magur]